MIVRRYDPLDMAALVHIHAQSGLDYQFPDLSSPLFLSKFVVERRGVPTTFLGAKLQAELYLMSTGAPDEKWQDIQLLDAAVRSDLWSNGIDDQFCAVPSAVSKHFGKRLRSLGYLPARPDWILWTRDTAPR